MRNTQAGEIERRGDYWRTRRRYRNTGSCFKAGKAFQKKGRCKVVKPIDTFGCIAQQTKHQGSS
jgi:hypothetical protein